MESTILEFINNILDKNTFLVYFLFNISCMLQLLFPPYPADVVLVFQGYVTAKSSMFSFLPVLLNAMCGSFIGSYIVYMLGYIKGDAIFNYKPVRRYIDKKHKARADKLFEKFGLYAIFISKFVPGVNAILILIAGIFKFKPRIVFMSIISSTLVHHILVLLLGRFLGHNLEFVKSILKAYNTVVIALALLTAAGFAAFRLLIWKKAARR